MMHRVYECDSKKKADLTKILEAEPYADGSFARAGYKLKDGGILAEDKTKLYVYIKASEDFLKKADEKLKGVADRCKNETEKRIVDKIIKEEEEAEGGFGSMFG